MSEGAAVERTGSAEVARYYDRNTRRFMLVGRGGDAHSMHRELWGPGVTSPREALEHVHGLIADEIAGALAAHSAVIDFGCGIGGTLFHLASRFPEARLSGLTVSPRQAEIAERLAAEQNLAHRCAFTRGDFQVTDLGVRAGAIVAVESLAHASDVHAFLGNAARHLAPGGRLVVVDDFLASDEASLDARQRRWVERFRTGWRVPAVGTVEALAEAASRHGLRLGKRADLTALTRPGGRARDWVVAAVAPAFSALGLARIPFYGNVIGGNALQVGLREGFLRYELLVLRAEGGAREASGLSREGGGA